MPNAMYLNDVVNRFNYYPNEDHGGGGGGDELAIGLISRVLPDEVIVPDGIEEIGSYAFEGCKGMKTIILPETVETIGQYAFRNCADLETIITPESCTTIKGNYDVAPGDDGSRTFYQCYKLKKAYFTNVTEITYNHVSEEESLMFVYAGQSQHWLGNTVSIVFPKLRRIPKALFKYCSADTIYIGADCTNIASDAFANMHNSSATINFGFAEGAVEGAPWGATNATINYNVPVPNVDD